MIETLIIALLIAIILPYITFEKQPEKYSYITDNNNNIEIVVDHTEKTTK